jgi:hypothetical protein
VEENITPSVQLLSLFFPGPQKLFAESPQFQMNIINRNLIKKATMQKLFVIFCWIYIWLCCRLGNVSFFVKWDRPFFSCWQETVSQQRTQEPRVKNSPPRKKSQFWKSKFFKIILYALFFVFFLCVFILVIYSIHQCRHSLLSRR